MIQKSASPSKPFYYVPYKITTNYNDEFIQDFDTKISTSKYTMILTDVVLSATNGTETRQVFIQKPRTDNTSNTGSAFGNFSTFQAGGTWHIYLDYADLVPYIVNVTNNSGWKFIWQIKTLVMSNSFVNLIPERTISGTASDTAADTAPAVN